MKMIFQFWKVTELLQKFVKAMDIHVKQNSPVKSAPTAEKFFKQKLWIKLGSFTFEDDFFFSPNGIWEMKRKRMRNGAFKQSHVFYIFRKNCDLERKMSQTKVVAY